MRMQLLLSRLKLIWCGIAVLLLGFTSGLPATATGAQVTMRARVVQMTPANYQVRIFWRWGGEGMGGNPVRGELTAVPVQEPDVPEDSLGDDMLRDDAPPPDPGVMIEHDKARLLDYYWLTPGAWSPVVPISTFKNSRFLFLTVMIDGKPIKPTTAPQPLRNLLVEFEFSYAGTVIKRFTEAGTDGPTIGIVIPMWGLNKDGSPSEYFINALGGLQQYAQRKVDVLAQVPWAHQPLPKKFAFVTDCGGYGVGSGYGIRTTSRDTMLAEAQILRQIGCNGFRAIPSFINDLVNQREGLGLQFNRASLTGGLGGYPIVPLQREPLTRKILTVPPGGGCPTYFPVEQRAAAAQAEVDQFIQKVRSEGVDEIWALTADEIGSVFDGAPEGKEHMGCCPYCRKAFQDYVKSFGLTLDDFGAPSWDDIRCTYGYFAKTWSQQQQERTDAWEAYEQSLDPEMLKNGVMPVEGGTMLPLDPEITAIDQTDKEAENDTTQPVTSPTKSVEPTKSRHRLSERGWNLLYYYSRRFNNEVTAQRYCNTRDALNRENEKKRRALVEGRLDAPEAQHPWLYMYALRGNTFLLGGHSLDFFDFYRHADNGFMYETSNRDPRIWQWDSYLCDVGRILNAKLGHRFGIYVKPHRGAPVQRALAAVSRRCTLIYWYTYGPEWYKGDSFGGNLDVLKSCSRAARLIGAAEDVIYDADWARPAEVAVVRPLTSEYYENNDSWENGKWIYTALQHAHIPVDPLDEGFLMSENLSRYKVIYLSGSHLRRDVAARLAQWVAAGGILYTNGGGLARDEAAEPLTALLPVFGLKSRGTVDVWADSGRYGAVGLGGPRKVKDSPANTAAVTWMAPSGVTGEKVPLVFGREVLDPAPGTEVLARYPDGGAAVTRHPHGKGAVYVVGFYAGLEYAVDNMKGTYNMATDYQAEKRRFVTNPLQAAGVYPVVDASHPLIEGIRLQNRETGRQAVTLMNWAYQGGALVPQTNVTIRLRDSGQVTQVTSVALDTVLPVMRDGADVIVTLKKLDDGDVLLIH